MPRYLHSDHQGSITGIATGAGEILNINSYDEYGIPAEGNHGRFAYTGQIWLDELEMYHYNARIYSPTLGRFLQTDPIGYEDQINLYAYVGNDPLNLNDTGGDKSYVVARRLDSAVGKGGFGHAFIATRARYPGDPRAKIYSFGPLANGKMGNVSDRRRAARMARNTAEQDRAAWLALRPTSTRNVSQIQAPDRVVDATAGSVKENRDYVLTPSKREHEGAYPTPGVNSNAAAVGAADKAETIASGRPDTVDQGPLKLWLPGAEAAAKVEFTCTEELKSVNGC